MNSGDQRFNETDDPRDDLRGNTANSNGAGKRIEKRSGRETPGIIVAVIAVLLLIGAIIYLGVYLFVKLPELEKKLTDNKNKIEVSKSGNTSEDDGKGQEGRGSRDNDPEKDKIISQDTKTVENGGFSGTGNEAVVTGTDIAGTDASGTAASGTAASGTEAVDIDITGIEDEAMTSGNFYNRGYFAFHKDACYFLHSSELFKSSRQDFSETEPLTRGSGLKYLNVYEDRVYFLDSQSHIIYRLEPDESEKVRVFGGSEDPGYSPETLFIHEGWCYFSNKKKLYRISMDELTGTESGSSREPECIATDFNFTESVYPSMCFLEDRIYYNGSEGITGINPDGSWKVVISKQTGMLITDGTDIYCWFGTKNLYRIGTDGRTDEILKLRYDVGNIINFNYCDGWICYVVKESDAINLWKIRADGSENQFVEEVCKPDCSVISMCTFPGSDYAYFYLLRSDKDSKETPLTPISRAVRFKGVKGE